MMIRIWHHQLVPIGSTYGIYANIGGILMVNVTISSIHGPHGVWNKYTVYLQARPTSDKRRQAENHLWQKPQLMGIPWPGRVSTTEHCTAKTKQLCLGRSTHKSQFLFKLNLFWSNQHAHQELYHLQWLMKNELYPLFQPPQRCSNPSLSTP